MSGGLPNFLCVGTQKAGTSTLFDILRQHPDIFLPEEKETHFFYSDENYSKGLDWYLQTFYSKWSGQKTVGDITPEYMYWSNVPDRIRLTLGGDVKLSFVLRHPIDRAYSQYLMSRRRGVEPLSFTDALFQEEQRITRGRFELNNYGYLARSRYLDQIRRFLCLFPRRQCHFMVFESDLIGGREPAVKDLLRFLDLNPDVHLDFNIHSNEAFSARSSLIAKLLWKRSTIRRICRLAIPSSRLRSHLFKRVEKLNAAPIAESNRLERGLRAELFDRYFRDEFQSLQEMTGKDLTVWKQ